jgi:osmotically-inducible protein OsmY
LAIAHCVTRGPLLAGTLGVAAFGASWAALGAPPSNATSGQDLQEIVVTAKRSDEAMAAKVEAALKQNPYIFSDHVTVTAKNGVVRVGGVVNDLNDLLAILRVARRAAGKGRVVNEIEYQAVDDAGNTT